MAARPVLRLTHMPMSGRLILVVSQSVDINKQASGGHSTARVEAPRELDMPADLTGGSLQHRRCGNFSR